MADKIISLRGEAITSPGEPVAEVVEALEKALAEARSGRTRAIAILNLDGHGNSMHLLCGEVTRAQMLGEFEMFRLQFLKLEGLL